MANTYGSNIKTVSLEYGTESTANLMPLVIGLSVGIFLLVFISSVIFIKRHSLKLIWKDNFTRRDEPEKEFDLCFLYSEESERDDDLVDQIVRKLRDEPLRYNIRLIKEIPATGGMTNFTLYGQANANSRRIAVVVSKDLMKEPILLACLKDAVQDQYRHLIFITYSDKGEMIKVDDIEDDDIKLAFRIAKKIQWPGDKPGRQLDNFYIKLRNYLPPPPPQPGRRAPEDPPARVVRNGNPVVRFSTEGETEVDSAGNSVMPPSPDSGTFSAEIQDPPADTPMLNPRRDAP